MSDEGVEPTVFLMYVTDLQSVAIATKASAHKNRRVDCSTLHNKNHIKLFHKKL